MNTYHRGVHTHMDDIKPVDRWWGNDNYEEIDSNVCNSLCLRTGKWVLINRNEDGKFFQNVTDKLTVQNLFSDLRN